MPLICLGSPKGGVGKTMLTANLAFAMQRLGLPVSVIDFDVQNALRLHFGMPLDDPRGYVAQAGQYADWQQFAINTPTGIRLLPYGQADEAQRLQFETRLAEDPMFLAEALQGLLSIPQMVVLADTPPGPSPALNALNRLADIRIAVLLADAASTALIPTIERGSFFSPQDAKSLLPVTYIVNQVDRRRRLNLDSTEFLQSRLGASLLGLVHRDEALAEALAMQVSIFTFDSTSASASAYDIDRIAQQLGQLIETIKRPSFDQRPG
ncbi:cellulose biosynthesis protein BcsQ [Azomonas macrocytogenes]|uniref:Cellulose synthase operon protein YhjQ n=1 Tax=Azomonas macrocytogenes TaxID=69962 RepID=A0A839T498_AZOMA|nr:cellulose biosynthesis protein BcsQ [Azomonas macrocytogenes]MBB3102543.1 cellulose synthase operon protein YhjQ [Azomonas macrocytogenes]